MDEDGCPSSTDSRAKRILLHTSLGRCVADVANQSGRCSIGGKGPTAKSHLFPRALMFDIRASDGAVVQGSRHRVGIRLLQSGERGDRYLCKAHEDQIGAGDDYAIRLCRSVAMRSAVGQPRCRTRNRIDCSTSSTAQSGAILRRQHLDSEPILSRLLPAPSSDPNGSLSSRTRPLLRRSADRYRSATARTCSVRVAMLTFLSVRCRPAYAFPRGGANA